MQQLRWLPEISDWRHRLRSLPADQALWPAAVALARSRIDFTQTNALDERIKRVFGDLPPPGIGTKPIRLALLGSSTTTHLHAGIRVACLRRNIHAAVYENAYGQYLADLLDASSPLHQFNPNAVLFALDAHHVTSGLQAAMSAAEADAALQDLCERLLQCWTMAKQAFSCHVMQQTIIDVFPALMGGNEHRLPGSRSGFIARLNARLRIMADAQGVDLIALDDQARRDGLAAWYRPALWYRSKQEIMTPMSPTYGELVARVMAARQGLSYKCLVLDLDNTLWGGVIGDDGLDGIALGQGSALGEGFAALQGFAKDLARRGIILAVSSKNDEANAVEAFDRHPEMVLRRSDIASFRANWQDKAANLRAVAEDLNIGLDSLVFLDDNPFERNLVRETLPMVAVPEVPDDPAAIPDILADAGYFESAGVSAEDRQRTQQYQQNRERESLRSSATDMDTYLRALDMQMVWSRFDRLGLQRITQLINKTNQFNLTTRRHTEADVLAVIEDERAFGLQMRLIDRFGDNGIIAIVIGRMLTEGDVTIDTWLMSCRVLGRGVERATLNLVAAQAQAMGARRLVGEFFPTSKNAMVSRHYESLGFELLDRLPDGGSRAALDLLGYTPNLTHIHLVEGLG